MVSAPCLYVCPLASILGQKEPLKMSNVTNEVFYLVVFHADKLEELDSCSETCNYLWDGFGQWKNDQWMRAYLQGLK